MNLITNTIQAFDNIERLSQELSNSTDLVDRLGLVHAWYIDDRNPEKPLFGFSKFIGYEGLNAEDYINNSKKLDGRNTEWALKEYCEELQPNSPQYNDFHDQLTVWLAGFGKKPRSKVRLMVLKKEAIETFETDDRRLLELMKVVADLLPLHQRHELRSQL